MAHGHMIVPSAAGLTKCFNLSEMSFCFKHSSPVEVHPSASILCWPCFRGWMSSTRGMIFSLEVRSHVSGSSEAWPGPARQLPSEMRRRVRNAKENMKYILHTNCASRCSTGTTPQSSSEPANGSSSSANEFALAFTLGFFFGSCMAKDWRE